MKTQTIRLIDVFFIGPFLIWIALTYPIPKIPRLILIGLGIATIIYNGKNYLENKNAV